MAWTAPITYVSGAVATAAGMNTYVKDDLAYLKGLLDGTGSDMVIFPAATRYLDGVAGNILFGTAAGPGRIMAVNQSPHLMVNCYYDGANYQRDDVSLPAWLLRAGAKTASSFTVLYAAPAANPIAWTIPIDIDTNGKLTGKGIYRPAEVSIAAAGTATFTHGLGALPLLVTGLYGASSGAEQNPLVKNGSEVYVNTVTSTQFTVTNQSAGTKWVLALALL